MLISYNLWPSPEMIGFFRLEGRALSQTPAPPKKKARHKEIYCSLKTFSNSSPMNDGKSKTLQYRGIPNYAVNEQKTW